MIFTLAWRNIWRNTKRTILLIVSIILGLLALLMAMSFMNGLNKSFVDNAINTEYSHVQIHHPEYGLDHNPKYAIQDKDSVVSFLDTLKQIESFTLRAKIEGLASTQKSSRGIKIVGIDPPGENAVTGMNHYILEGDYFKGIKRHPIVIGKKLAEQLGAKIKSKMLLTYFNANNELTAASFRVSGIVETNSPQVNAGYVFITRNDFFKIFGADNIVHEIAIKLHNIEDAGAVKKKIKSFTKKNKIESWKEIAPELESSINEARMEKTMVLVVIILAFSFGLINTMLMQVSERMREIGVLIANGMGRFKVSLMVIMESVMLVTLASVLGICVGFFVILYYNHYGMDFTSLAAGLASQGWSKIVYPVLYSEDYRNVFICSCVSGLIGATLPAFKAMRLNVVSIIRR